MAIKEGKCFQNCYRDVCRVAGIGSEAHLLPEEKACWQKHQRFHPAHNLAKLLTSDSRSVNTQGG